MGDANVSDTTMPGPQGHHNAQGHGHGHGHRRPWRPRFTDDEIRVFKECQRESTLYRALPATVALGALTFAAVNYGYLKPNARFGAIPKVMLAAILGYGIGKISYRKTCMKKMMELPNSNFGKFLKARQRGCGPWGPSREGLIMFGVGADPQDLYWNASAPPADNASAPEMTDA